MTENKFDAKLDQLAGAVKETAGKVLGDKELQAEGLVEKVAGKAKELVEDAKDTVEGAIQGLKNVTDDKE